MKNGHAETNGHAQAQDSLRHLDLRLPPLPQTLSRILKVLHASEVPTAEDVAEVIRRDPAVLSCILQHINSAYYGLRRSVTDIERAVHMMGPKTAVGTVVSLCLLEIDELMEGPAEPCVRSLLRHSEATAFLTRYLLNEGIPREQEPTETGGSTSTDGFTEGLLHDFGKLVLIYNYPKKAVSLYESRIFEDYLAERDPRTLEQLVFGYDHTQAGGYAASEMNFPQELIDVIRHHHNLDEADGRTNAMQTLRAVGAANRSTKAMGSAFAGVHPTDIKLDWETCTDHPVWGNVSEELKDEDDSRSASLAEDLSTKRRDIVFFSKFFAGRDVVGETHTIP